MTVTVNFKCDGCDKQAPGKTFLRRHFESLSGRGYGFGTYRTDTVEDVKPDGWHAFDPYTGCCYCPECWESIVNPAAEEAAESVREAGR